MALTLSGITVADDSLTLANGSKLTLRAGLAHRATRYAAGPPSGTGAAGETYFDTTNFYFYASTGAAWYRVLLSLYTPPSTGGKWDFSSSGNSDQCLLMCLN